MATKRATRSRSGEDHDGVTDVIEEEMNKWRAVAEMIGETLENVCNMGHHERNQLVLLLPADVDFNEKDATIDEKDATIDELLGSEDEDENRTSKRLRPHDLICDEATDQSKKLKLSYQNGNNDKSDNVSSPSSIHVTPDLSEFVSTPLSSQEPTNTPPQNHVRPNFKDGFGAKQGVNKTTFADDQIRSPIFKGRTKKEIKQRHESFGAEQGKEESELDSQSNAKLQLDSEEEEDSQNLLDDDVNDVITSIPDTPDDSPVYDVDPYSSIRTVNIETDDEEKNTVAINKLLDDDTLEVKMATNLENHNLNNSVEMVQENKLIRNAVIDKITGWKHDYKLSDISYLKESVPSHQECFTVMEQNPIKYKFLKVRTQVNIGLEAKSRVENLQGFYRAVKHIKKQSRPGDTPHLVAISTVAGIKSESRGGNTPDLVAVLAHKWEIKEELGQDYSRRPNLGLCTRKTRGRARSSVQQNDKEELNIQVDDSSDDFEDNKTAVDNDWHPDNKNQRTVKRRLAGEKCRYLSGGKTRNISGGSGGKKSEAQRLEDYPREEEIFTNEKQWLGKETIGKAIRGKQNGGGGFGRDKLKVEKINPNFTFKSLTDNFIDRGIQKSKFVLKEADKKERERKIEYKINKPRSVVSDNLAVGSPPQKASDDEVEVIGQVAPSPSPSGRTNRSTAEQLRRKSGGETIQRQSGGETIRRPSGGETIRRPSGGETIQRPSGGETIRRPSGGETIRRSIDSESLDALSQLGNVTVTRSREEDTEAGLPEANHGFHNIQPKQKDRGECPMCQREFWMNELEPHAAECQGRVNHELRRRL